MTQPFIPYPSTKTFTQQWIDEYVLPHYGKERFYVSEKIHGRSLTIHVTLQDIMYGRRKDWLTESKGYGGIEHFRTSLEQKLRHMFTSMREIIMAHHEAADRAEADGQEANRPDIPRDFQSITIRGEFYGGSYNHPEVPRVDGMHTVKSGGIQYSQETSFTAYRVEVDGIPQDMQTMGMLCMSFGIPHVPLLFMGTLQECIAWSKEHRCDPTVVPMGFPMLDEQGKPVPHAENPDLFKSLPVIEGNEREGHVIAPMTPITMANGSALILKDKNPKFAESKFEKTEKKPVDLTEFLKGDMGVLYEAILCRLTTNRMDNIMSHKAYELKDFNAAMGAVIQDTLDDLLDGSGPETVVWTKLETKDRKVLMKQVGVACRARLGEHFRANV